MSYTKNHDPWTSGDVITTTVMDNFETIYTEAAGHLTTHAHDDLYYTQAQMLAAYWNATTDGPGSSADADLIYKSTGNLHASSFSGLGVPTGLIILWYGSVATIPSGWQLCNGTGTPDLRGRMPIGSGTGATYAPGASGGSATFAAAGAITVTNHTLSTTEMGAHRHPFGDYTPVGAGPATSSGSYSYSAVTSSSSGNTAAAGGGNGHGHEGTSFSGNAVACLPYYYSLCYIQKV